MQIMIYSSQSKTVKKWLRIALFSAMMNRREYKELLYEEINTYSNYIGIYDAFAIFFGAGNMIFPPAMGQLAGTSYISALQALFWLMRVLQFLE